MGRRTKVLSRIGLLIAFIMMFSMLSFANSSETTVHNESGEWLSKAWARLYENQAFQLEKNLTRGEMVALINSLLDFKDKGEISFIDVTDQSPYYKEVAKAFKAGYIVGRGNNTFNPEGEITKVEAYIMIAKALKLDLNHQPEQMLIFKDANEVPQWAVGAVEAISRQGWIHDKNKVKPFEKVTGSEAVALLEKISAKPEETPVETPAVQEEAKGGGNNPLNFQGAFFVSIENNQSTDLAKIDEGNSSKELVIKLVFDRGVVRDNWEHNKQQIKLQANNGSIISSEVFRIDGVDAEKEHIFIKPLEELKSGKTVKIVIGKDLKANNGNSLGKDEIISFSIK